MFYTIPNKPSSMSSLPLEITAIGIEHETEIIHNNPSLTQIRWYYCLDGEGEIYLNNQKQIIRKGDGFIVFPSDPFFAKATSEKWILDQLLFEGRLSIALLEVQGITKSTVYSFFDKDIFHTHIRRIHDMAQQKEMPSAEAFSKACYDFLLDLPDSIAHVIRDIQEPGEHHEHDLVHKAILYLENYYSRDLSLDDLAAHVGLTKNYLCTLFKKVTKRTIFQELNYIRIGRARNYLIQNPNMNINEIARLCGFQDASYFGKVFKKIEGRTPEQYRRRQPGA